jgi:F0F1-type ATP synthase assembly protein I
MVNETESGGESNGGEKRDSLGRNAKNRERTLLAQSLYLAATIPALLVAGPLVGLFFGRWLGGRLGHEQAGTIAGLALGFVAGARESVRMIIRLHKLINR